MAALGPPRRLRATTSATDRSAVVEVPAGEAVQIRSLNTITGDVAYLGIPNQRGVELAVADFGPVNGFDVDLGTRYDDLCSSDGAQAAAQTIVADEDVVGVIGPSCSTAAVAAAPLVTAAGMVLIAPSNTSPTLTSDLAGNPGLNHSVGYYRTSNNGLYVGEAMARFASRGSGARLGGGHSRRRSLLPIDSAGLRRQLRAARRHGHRVLGHQQGGH